MSIRICAATTWIGILVVAGLMSLPAPARADAIVPVDAFPNQLDFVAPWDIEGAGDGSGRLFVGENWGRIYALENNPASSTRTLFLDLLGVVYNYFGLGLQSFVFHPDYATNGRFYMAYSVETPLGTRISEFTVSSGDSNYTDPATENVLLVIPKVNIYHSGMELAFGNDGFLYVSVGDDGVQANAQDLASLHGKILRIDVDTTGTSTNYGIPPTNPWAGNGSGYREEIYAFGFRNPWRFSIDLVTDQIWVTDVGEIMREEVNIIKAGGNYGWPKMEGSTCYDPPSCDTTGMNLQFPVFEYGRELGIAVIGGHVYRGSEMPGVLGRYLMADYFTGRIWLLDYDGNAVTYSDIVYWSAGFSGVTSFGEADNGELFIARDDNRIYKLTGDWTYPTAAPLATPGAAALAQNYPNPFNPTTTIAYELSRGGHVSLAVYDVTGRLVRTLADAPEGAGAHTAGWDGRDNSGAAVASGVYLYRLAVDDAHVATRRMTLLK